jgi:hypothetical protein
MPWHDPTISRDDDGRATPWRGPTISHIDGCRDTPLRVPTDYLIIRFIRTIAGQSIKYMIRRHIVALYMNICN